MYSSTSCLRHDNRAQENGQAPKCRQLERENGILRGTRAPDRPEINDGFSFMDNETYDSLPLTRWLDRSGKAIEDHPELSSELQETTIPKTQPRVTVEILLKSKLVIETLKAKGYDLEEVEKATVTIKRT